MLMRRHTRAEHPHLPLLVCGPGDERSRPIDQVVMLGRIRIDSSAVPQTPVVRPDHPSPPVAGGPKLAGLHVLGGCLASRLAALRGAAELSKRLLLWR